MATNEKAIDDTKNDKETEDAKEASDIVNSDEDPGKNSDVDMISDEDAKENTDSNDKSNDSITEKAAKPKSDTTKSVRGRLVQRGTGRGFMHRATKRRLPKIPEGILYVKNGTYIGYHCTYCNCALKTLLTVKQHVAGARHQETLASKKIKDGSTAKKTDNSPPKPPISPTKQAKPKSDLKSSLDEYLAAAKEPIVGLSHIVETVIPDKPSSFECNLCKFSCNVDEMKEHVSGTRHRLMYLKTVDPKRIAEMMSKNLNKTERNQKIADHAKELEGKHGRGSIEVKSSETSGKQQDEKPVAESSNKPVQSRGSIRRPRGEWVRGRGRGLIRGGRFASVRRGMRGIRGGRRPLIRGGRRGNLIRGGRILKRPLSRMSPEGRKQSNAKRFRGRISHNNARAPPFDPYDTRESYYADYADWVMRNDYADSYEVNPYYGRDPYYADPYSAPREHYIEEPPYERIDHVPPQELYPRYDYRPPYEYEPLPREYEPLPREYEPLPREYEPLPRDYEPLPREYGSGGFRSRDRRSTSPSRNRSSQRKPESADVEANPSKNLPSFNVANEKDAGVVMNVITSLAESLLGYKMRGSDSAEEILQKLGEGKKKSAGSRPDKSDLRATEKFSKTTDAMDQPAHNWSESGEMRTRNSSTYDPSARGWAGRGSQDQLQHKQDIMHDRTPPLPRRQMDTVRDRSPPRRPMDVMRDRSPPPPRRPLDMRGDRSPPSRRPMDVRDRSPPRRPMDVMRDRSPPPKRPMDIMRDRSPPLSRRPMDVMRSRSPPRGAMGVMRDRSPPLSRRPIDVTRNRSPPPSRGSFGVMRDRSPPPPRNHPSFVDDMFDDYQKSQNAMKSSYATPTGNEPPGYRSSFSTPSNYGTPASYQSPSFNTTSSFNRSSEARRLPSTGGFTDSQERNVLDWKYRSLR